MISDTCQYIYIYIFYNISINCSIFGKLFLKNKYAQLKIIYCIFLSVSLIFKAFQNYILKYLSFYLSYCVIMLCYPVCQYKKTTCNFYCSSTRLNSEPHPPTITNHFNSSYTPKLLLHSTAPFHTESN